MLVDDRLESRSHRSSWCNKRSRGLPSPGLEVHNDHDDTSVVQTGPAAVRHFRGRDRQCRRGVGVRALLIPARKRGGDRLCRMRSPREAIWRGRLGSILHGADAARRIRRGSIRGALFLRSWMDIATESLDGDHRGGTGRMATALFSWRVSSSRGEQHTGRCANENARLLALGADRVVEVPGSRAGHSQPAPQYCDGSIWSSLAGFGDQHDVVWCDSVDFVCNAGCAKPQAADQARPVCGVRIFAARKFGRCMS